LGKNRHLIQTLSAPCEKVDNFCSISSRVYGQIPDFMGRTDFIGKPHQSTSYKQVAYQIGGPSDRITSTRIHHEGQMSGLIERQRQGGTILPGRFQAGVDLLDPGLADPAA
jgi:hypothetical protein